LPWWAALNTNKSAWRADVRRFPAKNLHQFRIVHNFRTLGIREKCGQLPQRFPFSSAHTERPSPAFDETSIDAMGVPKPSASRSPVCKFKPHGQSLPGGDSA